MIFTTFKNVVTISASQGILPVISAQDVIAISAFQGVIATSANQNIKPTISYESIFFCATIKDITRTCIPG